VITNPEGGELAPGAGMMLRLSEGYTQVGGTALITQTPQTLGTVLGGGTVLVETLPAPSPNLRYRVSLAVDVTNTDTATAADVVLFLDTSVDGVNWIEQVNNARGVGATVGTDGNDMHCRLDMTLRLGSDLIGGMPASAPSLRARGRIAQVGEVAGVIVDSRGSSGPYNDFVGTCLLQLSEHF